MQSFFHHYILEPKVFPAKNKALHLATYSLPKIYSNLIQSNIRRDVFVNVQSEKALN